MENHFSRREWIVLASFAVPFAGAAQRRLRLAQIGTGSRGTHWAGDIMRNYADVVEIVGLCDINGKRVEAAKEIVGSGAPTFVDFDRMIEVTKPDAVLITTIDSSHCQYIIRAMELGVDVITEKPLCTDEEQCRQILDAEKKYRRKLTVAFNARHYPQAMKVKQLIQEKAIGEVITIDYQEYLNTSHGASYFRRWHRMKENSGTLLVSKSCHHFDQVNWWLESVPAEVIGWGDLRFYGRNNPFRGTHCRGCAYKQKCQFYTDVTRDRRSMQLYVNCESEDGYQIDGCLWRQDINIYDTFTVMAKFESGARLNYTANTFMPYEGQEIGINGTKGRIDFNMYDAQGYSDFVVRLTRNFGKSEVVKIEPSRTGGHGGADPGVRDLIFRGGDPADPLKLKAGSIAGAYSSLVGIAGYHSIERGGERVKLCEPRQAVSVPCELVFNPNWWHRNYGIRFDEPFYFDREARIANDLAMRRALWARYGAGEADPQPRQIIGSEHVAGGFVMPALFGCQIRFAANEAPWPVPRNLPADEVRALRAPHWQTAWPMDRLIADMDRGCLYGDFDLDGVLNTALQVRGQDLYLDFFDAPDAAHHLLSLITETQIELALYMRRRTGTCGVSCNRSILNVDRGLFLHSNCSVQMVSPKVYRVFLLPYERRLAAALAPYGIHHCGNNLHLFAPIYAELPLAFVDVGWGSDVARCRAALPHAFLNLRLSPVRMLQQSNREIREDAERLLASAGANAGLCAINMDYGTPDENVHALLHVARLARAA